MTRRTERRLQARINDLELELENTKRDRAKLIDILFWKEHAWPTQQIDS